MRYYNSVLGAYLDDGKAPHWVGDMRTGIGTTEPTPTSTSTATPPLAPVATSNFNWITAISTIGNTAANIIGSTKGSQTVYTAAAPNNTPAPVAQVVQQAQQGAAAQEPPAPAKNNTGTIILVVVAFVVFAVVAFFLMRKK